MDYSKRTCKGCIHAKFKQRDSILASGYICMKNPFRPVAMGLKGKCSERERYKKQQYRLKNKRKIM